MKVCLKAILFRKSLAAAKLGTDEELRLLHGIACLDLLMLLLLFFIFFCLDICLVFFRIVLLLLISYSIKGCLHLSTRN